MFDSEGKVKQMQGHFLALKEHLTSDALLGSTKLAEDLQEQLKEMKVKYEGASMEVGKLRNQMKQNEMLVVEMKRDESRLLKENQKLQEERGMVIKEQEKEALKVSVLEGQLRNIESKLSLSVPAEKFENMKSLLTNEVNEKAKYVVEKEQELVRSQTELTHLQKDLEMHKARVCDVNQENKHIQNVLEKKTEELKREVAGLTLKNQNVQKEAEKAQHENNLLQQQISKLKEELSSQYVPLKMHAELKKACDLNIQNLSKQLAEARQKHQQTMLEINKLVSEKTSLRENVSHLQAVYVSPEKYEMEVASLKANVADVERQREQLVCKFKDEEKKVQELVSEKECLESSLKKHYLPVSTHQEVTAALTNTLETVKQELLELQQREQETHHERGRVNQECNTLKQQLSRLQEQVRTEYVSLAEHKEKVDSLCKVQQQLQDLHKETLAKHVKGQEEVAMLHAAIEGQKRELDMLQDCIKVKYAPVASIEERERSFQVTLNGLKNQLIEQTQRATDSQEEARKLQLENERLKADILSLQKDLQHHTVLQKTYQEKECQFTDKLEVLNGELREVLQKYADMEREKERLEDENAKHVSEALAVQAQMQGHYVPMEQLESLKNSLGSKTETLEDELLHQRGESEAALERVRQMQLEMEHQREMSLPLSDHNQMKEQLEMQIDSLQGHLREEQKVGQAKEEVISQLHVKMQSMESSLLNLQKKALSDLTDYESVKSSLEAQVASMEETMRNLQEKYKEKCEEAAVAQHEGVTSKNEAKCLRAQSFRIEQEIRDLKERYDSSLATIEDLQRSIKESAKQLEVKDHKITKLLNDVERLKQALSDLSQLTYATGVPSKRQNQQLDVLQSQVNTLQQQLAEAERRHQEIVSIYRTHLLSAVQGRMDEDVQEALLQIIRMRQGLVC